MRHKTFCIPLFIAGFIMLLSMLLPLCAEEAGEEIKIYVGEPKVISVSNPTRVVIGNPAIADVVNATKNEITLSPKSQGMTSLVVWDNFGEQSYRVRVFSEHMDEFKRRIDSLLSTLDYGAVYTRVAEDEGKVLLMGNVKYPQDRERVFLALGPLKDKIVDLLEIKEEERAIEIDVQLLEVDKGSSAELGFSWPSTVDLTEVGSPGLTGAKWSTLFKVVSGTREAFTLKLTALIKEKKARVLSRPRLSCQSGKEAELLVGGEVPIFETQIAGSSGSSGNSVEYKEYGIKLKIKPNVTPDERIKLGVNVEISEVGEAEQIGPANAPTARAYPLTKRNASTQLFLNDGESMAIGGLMRQKHEELVEKIPFLGDIPLIGGAFRKRTTKVGGDEEKLQDTELFIILTPRLVRSEQNASPAPKKNAPVANSPAAVAPQQPQTPVSAYTGIIKNKIMSTLTYPASAKSAGFQGTARLKVHLNYNGELIEAVIEGTSGYKVLDDNALAVARGISSYPPFPPAIEAKDLWITVPVTYQLD